MVELREHEQTTLLTLQKLKGKAPVNQIVKASGLAHAAVMRASLSLTMKKLTRVHEQKQTVITLNEEGRYHAKKGLPERRLIRGLLKLKGKASVDEAVKEASLEKKFLTIALGWLNRKGWATIEKKKQVLKAPKEPQIGVDEKLLSLLDQKGLLIIEKLNKQLQDAVPILKRRKLVKIDEKTLRELELTEAGWKLVKQGIEIVKEVSQLTPELIRTRNWRKVKLRRFDVTAPGPAVYPAKIHPVQQIIQRIREIFLEMGFTEIRGPIVETAFWNFDALFQPQDHPAREMQDTLYCKTPSKIHIKEKKLLEEIAKVHKNGGSTSSTGWGYEFSEKEGERALLRTHTTVNTIRYLYTNPKPPSKVFSIGRVFRKESIDTTHLPEFYQIEGIVNEEDTNFKQLIGVLKEFYRRIGFEKIRFRPGYFPYTEPSMEVEVYWNQEWMELGGSGVFRPEVTEPVGVKNPVLAWGLGLERLAMLKFGLNDIRSLYISDLDWLRKKSLI